VVFSLLKSQAMEESHACLAGRRPREERHYDRPVFPTIFSFSEARRNSSGAFMRSQVRLKSLAGPLHLNSSIDLNTGTSTRSVARVRNSSASSQPAKSASARGRALRNVGSQ